MPLRNQGYCGFGRGLSGLLWVWCNGREPHLELRQEPHGSSRGFPGAGTDSNHSFPAELVHKVRPRLVWRNGTPLASRVVHGVIGPLSSCLWNLRVFRRCTGASVLLPVVPSSTGLPSKRCPGIGFSSSADREIGVFPHVAPPTRLHLEFPSETGLILRCAGKVGTPCRQSRGIDPPFGIRRRERAQMN